MVFASQYVVTDSMILLKCRLRNIFFLLQYKSLFFFSLYHRLCQLPVITFCLTFQQITLHCLELSSRVKLKSPFSLGLSPIRQLFHIFFIFLFDVLTSSGFRWELVQLHKHNFRLALRKYLQQKSKWRCYEVWIRSLLALCEINM